MSLPTENNDRPDQGPADTATLQMVDGTKGFGGEPVLRDMQLRLNQGETLVILGRSGSGKTVLLKCLVGLMKLDEGSVLIQGQDLGSADSKALNQIRKKLGFLFQGAAIYDSLSVRENLEFHIHRQLQIQDDAEVESLVMKVLQDVGLEEAIGKMPSELSGGMRKRLGLARALVSKPDLMLYDEPTTGLDPVTSQEISRLIRDTQSARGVASLVVTHDMRCAQTTADRIIVLRDGAACAEGTYAELESSSDADIKAFFS
ncbi:MAG: ATP-binding cassette domain-containing protein [Holophaga sp.]|nr:ATP-binding cassette domain-containing protein [Holophaga sp.]